MHKKIYLGRIHIIFCKNISADLFDKIQTLENNQNFSPKLVPTKINFLKVLFL